MCPDFTHSKFHLPTYLPLEVLDNVAGICQREKNMFYAGDRSWRKKAYGKLMRMKKKEEEEVEKEEEGGRGAMRKME